jgi:hypothetical protein
MNLDLSDAEAAALTKELAEITGNDRYPFSERVRTLKAILAKIRSEPEREPLRRRRCTRCERQPPKGGAHVISSDIMN